MCQEAGTYGLQAEALDIMGDIYVVGGHSTPSVSGQPDPGEGSADSRTGCVDL